MSSARGARGARMLFVVICVLAVGLMSALPASAAEGKGKNRDKDKGRSNAEDRQKRRGVYVLKEGPCDVKKLPKRASRQWTPAGESIVHEVAYAQGLQQIALKYGFKGDEAYRVLWDANRQLKKLELEQSGITVRIPVCRAELKRRKLPKPPPPPEPEEEPSGSDGGSGGGGDESDPPPQDDAPPVAGDSVWDQLAECESGGNWAANTGNGYYGGIQFSLPTWQSVGGSGYPHEHSREEQIKRGKILQQRSGWGQWPHCAAELGLI